MKLRIGVRVPAPVPIQHGPANADLSVVSARTVTRDGRTFKVEEVPGEFDFWALAFEREWEADTFEVLRSVLTPGSTFVDIGGWVGPMAMYASTLCGRVVSAEPDPVAAELFRMNIAHNGYCNVELFEGAICTDGQLRVGVKESGVWGDSMTSALFIDESVSVPSLSVETLFDRYRINDCALVKIDIEGGEIALLEHNAEFLFSVGAPLWLSTHAPLVDDPATYQSHMTDLLRPWGQYAVSDDFDSILIRRR